MNLQPGNIPGYFNVELLRTGRRELEECDQTEIRRYIKVGVPTVGQESATDFFLYNEKPPSRADSSLFHVSLNPLGKTVLNTRGRSCPVSKLSSPHQILSLIWKEVGKKEMFLEK